MTIRLPAGGQQWTASNAAALKFHGAYASTTPWAFDPFIRAQDEALGCPGCRAKPGSFHGEDCANRVNPLSMWTGPKTPGMLLVELVDTDVRLQSGYCMKCEQPVLPGDKVPEDPELRHVFLTRHGIPIHVKCVLALAAELEAPLLAISEEYEARRRALTGE